jgi:hypothetical protein
MAQPQKKPGLGVMIAIGRPKGAPAPPPGMKGAPGGESGDEPDEQEPAGDETGDFTIYPEAVNYHDDPQSCSICKYMNGSMCAVLKMEVQPQGGCNAFSGKDSGEESPDEGSGNGADTDAGSGPGAMA